MEPQFTIWTGGGPWDEEVGRHAAVIPTLPDPDPLPRIAYLVFWWGRARFEAVVHACSIRNTRWGKGRMTWLDFKGTQVIDGTLDGAVTSIRLLVPAEYVTDVRPGSIYTITARRTGGVIGLYPPDKPAPPHALPPDEIEHRLAKLSDALDSARGFAVGYPLYALRRPDTGYVGFGPRGERSTPGPDFGIPVFSTELAAERFLRTFERTDQGWQGGRVERFDGYVAFRRFLRSVRDSGTVILFDPASDRDGFLFVDHTHSAAVLLERFLPQPAWGWSYPVYVLRAAVAFSTGGFSLHTTEGVHPDGRRWPILPVFTDTDLAERALPLAPPGAEVMAVPDSKAFARLLEELPANFLVSFDHEQARGPVGKVVLSRDDLLTDLDAMEL